MSRVLMICAALFALNGYAQGAGKPSPCDAVKADCTKAGFVVGEAKEGKGLWWDCLCPMIVPGFPRPANAALPQPSDPAAAGQCTSSPAGQKMVANCQTMLAKKGAAKGAKPAGH